jgi:hypothetical protein
MDNEIRYPLLTLSIFHCPLSIIYMLEKDRLLILPWSSTAGLPSEDVAGLTRLRRIQDGILLGFAGWAPQSWWRGRTIRVFEIPDASLLMTLHRPWGPMRMWQVFDAEDRRIGSFYRQLLFDDLNYHLANLEDEKPRRPRRFLTRSKEELASLEWESDGTGRLSFHGVVNPFARMNLLAMVLTMPFLPEG